MQANQDKHQVGGEQGGKDERCTMMRQHQTGRDQRRENRIASRWFMQQRFPPPEEMLVRMKRAGFAEATWTPYTFGIAGLYRGKMLK